MKIDRLLGILTILLKNENVTAPELADRFEVSRRTINRDVEDLCKAGIPIVTTQGNGGGICIADGYKIDKTLFTKKEMQAILTGLKSLDSVSGGKQYSQLMDKLYEGKASKNYENVFDISGHIVIDLASYYKGSLAPKIELLKDAIEATKLVQFYYYSTEGENYRVIEPYLIVFQWSSWYVWGYCKLRNDFRLFKLNRLIHLKSLEENFIKHEVPSFKKEIEEIYQNNIHLIAEFKNEVKWRLIEEYGIDSFEECGDKVLFEFDFANEEHVFSWLLGFGDKVKIIEPGYIREKYLKIISNINKIYEQT